MKFLYFPLKPPIGEKLAISQVFGVNGEFYRVNGIDIIGHNGLDIVAKHGQPVYTSHDGIITFAGLDEGGGIGVDIKTSEKYEYDGRQRFFKTRYWHLKKYIIKVGDKVEAGDIIGYADNTGFSTGDHLHFDLKPLNDDGTNYLQDNGYYGCIDPYNYFFINTMKHITINNNQYLLYEPLKIAISIADVAELNKLQVRGLNTFPIQVSENELNGYWIISGIEISRIKDIFNI